MKIGIIGAGNLGTGIGRRLAAVGHELTVSFARTAAALDEAVGRIGGTARATTIEDAARQSEVVLLATPWAATLDVVRTLAPLLDGRIVWDATNCLAPDMSGLVLGTTTSGGEAVAAAAFGSRVVKAVPPFAELLHAASPRIDGRRPGVFVCGDDAAARASVAGLVDDIDAEAVDAGPLRNARYTEPLGMLLVQLAYAQGMGARIGASLLRDQPGESAS